MESNNNVVLWSGDRNYSNADNITKIIQQHPARFHLVGDCAGVDTLVKLKLLEQKGTLYYCNNHEEFEQFDFSKASGNVLIIFIAHWKTMGVKAGPIRNSLMITCGQLLRQRYNSSIQLVAVHPNYAVSKGTKNIVNQAGRQRISCRLYTN